MINFSKAGTKEEVLQAINELPEETESAPKEIVAQLKASAVLLIGQTTTNGVHCNMRCNKLNQWLQIECQVSGQVIKPKAAVAGTEAVNK